MSRGRTVASIVICLQRRQVILALPGERLAEQALEPVDGLDPKVGQLIPAIGEHRSPSSSPSAASSRSPGGADALDLQQGGAAGDDHGFELGLDLLELAVDHDEVGELFGGHL
jgi:hypothetical protein